jgi:hypothetical protein
MPALLLRPPVPLDPSRFLLRAGTIIGAKHQSLGGDAGWLGAPVGEATVCPDGRGWFQPYRNGSIYWAPGAGTHEVHGAIRDQWAAMGWERSGIGYPTSDEIDVGDGRGRVSQFERGSIYWTPQTWAHEIYGVIRERWLALGGPASFLGYPTTGERDLPNGRGRFNDFERGQIAWSPAGGAVVSATTYDPAAGGGLRPQGLGPNGDGVPEVRRKVVCSGTMHITDDETFGSDEYGDASSPPLEAVVTNESPGEVLPGFVGRAGGEVRVEVKLTALARNSGDVTVTGKVLLFEGTSTETNDLDGQVDVNITVPRDQIRSYSVQVVNQAEGGDHAELLLNFSNFPV